MKQYFRLFKRSYKALMYHVVTNLVTAICYTVILKLYSVENEHF